MMLEPSKEQGCSLSYDSTIRFSWEHPPTIQHGASLNVSVVVMFGESNRLSRAPTQAFAVNVSLVDEYGTRTGGGLQGSLTSNMQFPSNQHAHGLAVINDLAIRQTGRRRLRVLLGVFSGTGMTVEARADSHIFHAST
ncbi:unnamed protein product [Penicillium nalgiovense]|nr:unnamed protein product [Penicillium nalgiovense]